MSQTITEFLEARIAEDEKPAYYYGSLALGTARVLAECAAKRAIIEQWEDPDSIGPLTGDVDAGHAMGIDSAIRELAAVYSDHPDYQQEWAA